MGAVYKIKDILLIILTIILFLFSILIEKKLIVIPYILLLIIILKNKKNYISPLFYLFIPWSFMFLVYFLELIVYKQGSKSNLAIIYLIAGNILIVIGYYLGKKIILKKNKKYISVAIYESKLIKIINLLALMGIIGSLLFLIEMIFVVGIGASISSSELRHMFINRQVTILSQIGNLTSWGSLIGLSASILLWNKIKQKERVLWLFSGVIYCGYSVLSAGRQVIFQCILIIISSVGVKYYFRDDVIKKKKSENQLKNKILVCLVLLIGIGYCLNLASVRNDGKISKDKKVVLEYYFDCEFTPEIEKIISGFPQNLGAGITELLVYFTHQISGFTTYWSIDDSIGPFYGLYSKPFLDRRFQSLGMTEYSVEEKMNYVRNHMASQGAMNVGWKTSFSFYILDYGRTGGLIYCFLFGIISGKIMEIYLNRRSIISALLLTRVNVGMFYTIMFPATAETGLFLIGIFLIIMLLFESKEASLHVKI